MPNFGKGGSRAPRAAANNARPSARRTELGGKSGGYKIREDGRGGRAPHRQNREDAPRGKRTPFFEAQPPRADRAERTGRGDRFERTDRFERSDRPERGGRDFGRDRNDRDARGGRDFGGARTDRGARSDRPAREMRDGREDRGRDWQPSGRPAAGGRKPRHTAEDRARRSYGDDARPARNFDRADRFDRPERSDRPQRGTRDFGGDRDRGFNRDDRRDDRRPARDFGADRPQRERRDFGGDRDRGFNREEREQRNPIRADRMERDRSRDESFRDARGKNPNKKAFFEDKVLERLESVDASDAVIVESFADMGLHPKLITALEGMGAETPFPIQAATIPAAIGGQDVLGRGKTGSGKTIAFSVPLITKLIAGGSQPRKPGKPRALILAPTRELADQIDRTVKGLAKPVGFYTVCIYGGVPQRKQENSMSRGVDIVVATPGRLEDLMAQGIIDLSEVETLVVDEADHMCDLGFIEGVRRVMRACGDSQQLLFSATLDRAVDALVREFLPNPYVYEVPNEENDTANITHRVFVVEPDDRSAVLLRLVQGAGKSLIFARTKMTAERLSESLTEAGVPAARLHGDLNQNQRNRNLERFSSGQVRVLVATDVAARGIHVDDVALVIQVDPPEEYKTYLHRSGRTGRGHSSGTVVTLIYRSRFRRMEDLLRRADRQGIFTDVRPSNPILEELAGPIAPPPVQDLLDFGDSRGGGRGRDGGRDGGRGGFGGGGDRPRRSNFGGNGKGRWADRPDGTPRPRDKKKFVRND